MAWAGESKTLARRRTRTDSDADSAADANYQRQKSPDGPKKVGDCAILFARLKEAPINTVLFLAVPAGAYASSVQASASYRFWLNFLALIPLSSVLGMATEDISAYTSEVQAGLINATFGNVVEMMVSFMALKYAEIQVVQSALLGSILSNLLFVLGCCLFYGGSKTHELKMNAKSGMACTSLLLLACAALALPTSVSYLMDLDKEVHEELILTISRFTSLVLFLIYLQFLYFQLYSHKDYFDASPVEDDDDEDDAAQKWTVPFSILMLGLTTVVTAYSSDLLVASVEDFSESLDLSRAFIGLILVASVGNVPEFYVTLMVAGKNQIDLALTIAVGSSCQMALFVTPLTVMVAWAMDINMTLDFHVLQIVCLLLAVLVVSSVIQSGHATWLQGSLLVATYIIIAVIFFFLPKDLTV